MPVLEIRARGEQPTTAIDALFHLSALPATTLAHDPDFYRTAITAGGPGRPESCATVGIPGHHQWRRCLQEAIEADLLSADIEPDAFGIVSAQFMKTVLLDWAHGALTLDALTALAEYNLSLSLLAFATEHSRALLKDRMQAAERSLKLLRHTSTRTNPGDPT